MSQQNKSQAQVAALEAKIAEQQLHIEVLASNMFAQKQRADELQQELNELDELISPDDDMHTPSGRVDYGLLTVPAFRTRFFNRPLTPAEAEVIESEMGRIELAAETENAQSDCGDAYEAWLESQELPDERQRLTPAEAQAIESDMGRFELEAPTISADVIFTDEGKLCVKLESSAGQESWYGFSATPDGKPRLVLLPDGVDELPF